MPDKKLSKPRIKEHIRKYAPIYLVGFVICLLLTDLLYTTTRPQTPYEAEVMISLADVYTNPDPLSDIAQQALEYGKQADETLESVHFEALPYSDPESDYTSSYLLMARASLGDCDLYFASALCADALCRMQLSYPLDDALASGWMADSGLEPYMYTDEETGETIAAGMKLDALPNLANLGAMYNEGAVLIVASNGTNIETSMNVAEYIVEAIGRAEVPAASEG